MRLRETESKQSPGLLSDSGGRNTICSASPFKEKTCLINRSEEGLSFRLLRPVTKGGMLEISFSPDCPELSFWIDVKVAWVKERLDGYQTLGVKGE